MEKQQLTLNARGPTADLILQIKGTGQRVEGLARPIWKVNALFLSAAEVPNNFRKLGEKRKRKDHNGGKIDGA